MGYVVGIVVVVVGILASVALHEVGHMVPAKKFGVLVPDYAVGFGPALWKKKIGETTYALRAVLLGGYVKILGMYPPAREGARTLNRKGRPTLAEEARQASAEDLPEGQEARAFYNLSAPKKIVVMVSGPLMNLLICVVLSAITMIGIGAPRASTTLAAVSQTVAGASGESAGPAHEAGVRAGDLVESWNGRPIASWSEFHEAIAASPAGEPQQLGVKRGQEHLTFEVTPVEGQQGRVVGVTAGFEYVSASPADVVAADWQMFTSTASVVVRLPQAVWNVAGGVTGDPSSLGLRDTRQVVAVLLSLLASLNMALFVFNLIPLPPLDGGHIVGACYEWARGALARARGKADPGPADTARMVPLTWAVGGVLVAMSVILIAADIIKPVSLA